MIVLQILLETRTLLVVQTYVIQNIYIYIYIYIYAYI